MARSSSRPQSAGNSPLPIPLPPERHIQVFAFDPALETDLDIAPVNQATLAVPWEKLEPGPVGEYLEVVDIDPASQCGYDPLDLDDPHILATNGLRPSDGVPQFHQQMVYAVAMKTIENFELALGRPVLWAERKYDDAGRNYLPWTERYVPRLRIYPHAFRGENAFYSPQKKALLFGYFTAQSADPTRTLPGGMVFTCSSHDIVAHETTHAIVDGIYPRLLNATNNDMLPLHEGTSDLIAIFQHFTLPGVLESQIQQTRGDLSLDSLLTRLAVQFGYATGAGNCLRNALGVVDPQTGRRTPPDPNDIERITEAHGRGAILVAAVFDAFLEIYYRNIADLKRIASRGTGVLPIGDLHPDLVHRMAAEASKVAQRLLTACIRALDYLPPLDVTFGDYLRALVTADVDLAPNDSGLVRLAMIEGFRRRGILPRDVRTLTVESLMWCPPDDAMLDWLDKWLQPLQRPLIGMVWDNSELSDAESDLMTECAHKNNGDQGWNRGLTAAIERLKRLSQEYRAKRRNQFATPRPSREMAFLRSRLNAVQLHSWIVDVITQPEQYGSPPAAREVLEGAFGLDVELARERERSRSAGRKQSSPMAKSGAIEVHSVRPRYQLHSDGRTRAELVVRLTQRRAVPVDQLPGDFDWTGVEGIWMRGGCTLIIDPDEARIRYCVSKRINSEYRFNAIADFHAQRLREEGPQAVARYDFLKPAGHGTGSHSAAAQSHFEPFAALHNSDE
jgi:hypothetical protein